MLIRFEVSNFRSIADSVALSLVAIDSDQESARPQARLKEHLLTRAAIFGPNASGKSSILAAIDWVRTAILDSLRRWDDGIPVEPHAFGQWPTRTTSFILDLSIDGVRHEYELELDSERVHYESLYEYPEGRRKRVFTREGNDLTLQTGLGKLAGARELITERTLALSAMRRFGSPKVGPVIDAMTDIQNLSGHSSLRRFRRYPGGFVDRMSRTEKIFDAPPTLFDFDGAGSPSRERALALLRLADLGISDVSFREEPVEVVDGDIRMRRIPQLMHETGDAVQALDLHQESEGTSRWFSLIGPALWALQNGTIVLVDEIDSSLHPALTAELIRLFRDKDTNPANAQIIFTSHDTSLLAHLNRDEVWLTEKRPDGSTRLGALSDFAGGRIRKGKDIGDAYLAGRFGALPDTDRTELMHALGLLS
ncbi:ATP-binding protein [Microbacterium bovistercoris]|uniref:ATP-binding protein n=1 Tax=Microbacterium bovistercoris TaxID=2293570 RepID=A0A371NXP7_9MICO|nr:ATP-binding protein [Microbacterium bovistercoris]REJ08066.1 ATP-binding protein [Microbacterium bovistercoris]